MKFRRTALISVSDKGGLLAFARGLQELGYRILSTGGTYRFLKKARIAAEQVSDYTRFPEILGGRVKTLHPRIFSGILARSDQEKELRRYHMDRIDLVCCNFYPFNRRKNLENIDVGGVALLRAAAKNYPRVIPVARRQDYPAVLSLLKKGGDLDLSERKSLAARAFAYTAWYDGLISSFLGPRQYFPSQVSLQLEKRFELRYGENPHQPAACYDTGRDFPFRKIAGKELSYNNLLDIEAALKLIRVFPEKPVTAIIKHTVPCGVALGKNPLESFRRAFAGDPVSPYGGVFIFNSPVDRPLAEELSRHFIEVILAPSISPAARSLFLKKEKLILIEYFSGASSPLPVGEWRPLFWGGFLAQTADSFSGESWRTVSRRQPTPREMKDLKFAWRVAGLLKSNAIALVRDLRTVGLCGGATSRLDAMRNAAARRKSHLPELARGLVLASDGFFPFKDNVIEAYRCGVSAVVQPGGSKRDEEVIAACDRRNMALLFTGRRHFRH